MFKIFLPLLILPLFAKANTCKVEDSLYDGWLDQKTWVEEVQTPSVENPHFQYTEYRDKDNNLKTSSMDLGSIEYKAELRMKPSYKLDVFLKLCDDGFIPQQLHNESAPKGDEFGFFSLSLSFLPLSYLGKSTDFGDYQLSMSFEDGSIVKSEAMPEGSLNNLGETKLFTLSGIKEAINRQAVESIRRQLEGGYDGELEISIDGFPALACDLLRNKVNFVFKYSGLRTIDKVTKLQPVSLSTLESIRGLIQPNVNNVVGTNLKEFLAGFQIEEVRKDHEEWPKMLLLENPVIAMLGIHPQDFNKLNSGDLNCALDQTSDYRNNDNYYIDFKMRTQTLKQAQGE